MRYETPALTKMCLTADEASCRPYPCNGGAPSISTDGNRVYIGADRDWAVGPVCFRGPIQVQVPSVGQPGSPDLGHLLA